MLCDWQIEERVNNGEIGINPFDSRHLQPASYDVKIGNRFLTFKQEYVTIGQSNEMEAVEVTEFYRLDPKAFALGTTQETIRCGKHTGASIEGRSSIGRSGLSVHITAGFIDPGFCGKITLELKNELEIPIYIPIGICIAQIAFFHVEGPKRLYGSEGLGSKYQDQNNVTAARVFQ